MKNVHGLVFTIILFSYYFHFHCFIFHDILRFNTAQKMKFFIKDLFGKCPNLQETAYLVTFIEEIHNGKLHFLCSVSSIC